MVHIQSCSDIGGLGMIPSGTPVLESRDLLERVEQDSPPSSDDVLGHLKHLQDVVRHPKDVVKSCCQKNSSQLRVVS